MSIRTVKITGWNLPKKHYSKKYVRVILPQGGECYSSNTVKGKGKGACLQSGTSPRFSPNCTTLSVNVCLVS